MTLNHLEFSQLIQLAHFMKNIAMIAIDEIDCVSKWGKNFRKQFANLDMLQSFASYAVPFLSVTATAPLVLKQISSHLLFHEELMLIINIGNDRPNLMMVICLM